MDVTVMSKPLKLGLSSKGGMATDGASLRMELRSPMGTPSFRWLMSDGKWTLQIPANQLNLVAADAEQSLRNVTDGALGLRDFHQILMGKMTWLSDALVETLKATEDRDARLTLKNGATIHLTLDEPKTHLAGLVIKNQLEETLLLVTYRRYVDRRPTELALEIPRIRFTLTIDLDGWEPFVPGPSAFELPSQAPFKTAAMERVWPLLLKRLLGESQP